MANQYTARFYFLPYDANWSRLALTALPGANEVATVALARRTLFRNAVLSNLLHLRTKQSDSVAIFESLVNHMSQAKSFAGLESIYLSLLADPAIQQLPSYQHSLSLWSGRAPGVPSDVGALFYDRSVDRLSYLFPDTLQTLKPGGVNFKLVGSGKGLSTNIEGVADAIINQPFSPNQKTSMRPAALATPKNVPSERIDALKRDLDLLAAELGIAAAGLFLVPVPGLQIVAANFALASAVVVGLSALLPYVQALSANNSVALTVNGTPPSGAPVCGPDGTPETGFSGNLTDDGASGNAGTGTGGTGTGIGDGPGDNSGDDSGDDTGDDDGSGDGGGDDGCFVAETPIVMADGTLKHISQISGGDRVLWFDHQTGERGVAVVETVNAALARRTWQLLLDDGTMIEATAEQPLDSVADKGAVADRGAVDDRNSMRIANVSVGTNLAPLITIDGRAQRQIQQKVQSRVRRTVYDLRVGPPHRFIVGIARVGSVHKK